MSRWLLNISKDGHSTASPETCARGQLTSLRKVNRRKFSPQESQIPHLRLITLNSSTVPLQGLNGLCCLSSWANKGSGALIYSLVQYGLLWSLLGGVGFFEKALDVFHISLFFALNLMTL